MYCPTCGQKRISQETSYCSQCGYLLTGTAELLKTGGALPDLGASGSNSARSPRSRGLRYGLFAFLLTFLVVPLLALIAQVLDQQPDAALIAACVLGVGGILRMLYALMFESSVAGAPTIERKLWALFARRGKSNSLPAQKATTEVIFAAPTTGEWRQTKELQISAFTESATQPLNRDDK